MPLITSPARAGPATCPTWKTSWPEGGRGRELLPGDHRRHHGVAGGQVDAPQPGVEGAEDVERPEGGLVERGVDGQGHAGGGLGHHVGQEQLAPVDGVGDGAAHQGHDHQGPERGQPGEPHRQRRLGEEVHLVRDGHHRELAAHVGHGVADEQEPEVAGLPQRRDVGQDPPAAGPASVIGRSSGLTSDRANPRRTAVGTLRIRVVARSGAGCGLAGGAPVGGAGLLALAPGPHRRAAAAARPARPAVDRPPRRARPSGTPRSPA